jgi:hypothetical protein
MFRRNNEWMFVCARERGRESESEWESERERERSQVKNDTKTVNKYHHNILYKAEAESLAIDNCYFY